MVRVKTKKVWNVEDVARYLDVHPMTVYRYAKSGKIPAFKIGSDWRFYKDSIEQWIKDKENFYTNHVRGRRKTDTGPFQIDRRKNL
ncbi:MAG: helix-turn-helix domain-containing protein [Candidatus Omnitrophota bacterium]